MATEWELRERIVNRALGEVGKVQASIIGFDGKVIGWQALERIFREASPDYLRNNPRLMTHTVGGKYGIPHWCGIFAVWASQAARGEENIGTWPIGGPMDRVAGIRKLKPGEMPQQGDIGWRPLVPPPEPPEENAGHYVIVRYVIPSPNSQIFSIKTIEGNSGGHSEITAPEIPAWFKKGSFWVTKTIEDLPSFL